jgi:protein-disulfide isomerase
MHDSHGRRILPQRFAGAITFAFAIAASGCAALSPPADVTSDPTGADGAYAAIDDDGSVVAQVNGRDITRDELDDWIKERLFEREIASQPAARAYSVRKENLDFLIQDLAAGAEAERLGIDVDEVVRTVVEELGPVSDAEVRGYYQQNRAQLPPNQTFETIAPRIREFLEIQKLELAGRTLTKRADVRILLEPPRATVAGSGPSLGPADAPVTIVEFSDFQCPYCGRAAPVAKSLVDRYPDQVRLVYRHMPLDFHAQARDAASAAICADRQGQFWEFHDLLFENQQNLHVTQLRQYADELSLDSAALERCMSDPETTALIDVDARDARELGVTGTPAFFINGILITGARPLADFVEVIDTELQRLDEAGG